jgi:hypothetical protein
MPEARKPGRGGARPGSGPKPKPPAELRRNRIVVNLSDVEHAAVTKAAEGRPLADFARHVLLRHVARRRR